MAFRGEKGRFVRSERGPIMTGLKGLVSEILLFFVIQAGVEHEKNIRTREECLDSLPASSILRVK